LNVLYRKKLEFDTVIRLKIESKRVLAVDSAKTAQDKARRFKNKKKTI